MKTLKDFYTQTFTPVPDITLFKKVLEQANELPYIFRGFFSTIGFPHEEKYVIFNPKTYLRKSAYISFNLYTLWMSHMHPKWRPYPPRNKSLICSFSKEKAKEYSTPSKPVRQIVPLDLNVNIAVAPESDIWQCFDSVTLKKFLQMLNEILTSEFDIDLEYIYELSELKEILGAIERLSPDVPDPEGIEDSYKFPRFLEKWKTQGFKKAMNWYLDPDLNHFKVYKYKDLPKELHGENRECWLSAPALCIRVEEDQ